MALMRLGFLLLIAALGFAQPKPVIGLGGIVHETNTFNPKKTTLADFATGIGGADGTLRGQDLITNSIKANNTTAGFIHGADFEHRVDEEAQTLLGGLATGRGMGRRDQAEIFEIGHDIAHAGGAETDRKHARQVARADRAARFEVALDDLSEDVLAARIEHLQEIVGNLGHGRRVIDQIATVTI